jgi:hypothetical protein
MKKLKLMLLMAVLGLGVASVTAAAHPGCCPSAECCASCSGC